MAEETVKAIRILLVEDYVGDVLLTKEAFKESKIVNQIDPANDGEQAMEMLYRQGQYE